jgi:hypothetical protein
VEARQRGDDVTVLLVEVLEGGIFVENVHALPLREDHPDGAVLEYQPRFPLQKDRHLLIHSDQFLASRAEGLRCLDQEVQQRRMAHQTIDLVDCDDAPLLIDQAVAADGA